MAIHHIIVGCIDYGEGTALLSCGENKAYADILCAELNKLAKEARTAVGDTRFDLMADWKERHGLQDLKENMLTDKYEVHEALFANTFR